MASTNKAENAPSMAEIASALLVPLPKPEPRSSKTFSSYSTLLEEKDCEEGERLSVLSAGRFQARRPSHRRSLEGGRVGLRRILLESSDDVLDSMSLDGKITKKSQQGSTIKNQSNTKNGGYRSRLGDLFDARTVNLNQESA